MGVILRYSTFLRTYKTRGYRIKHLEYYKKLFPIKSNPILAEIVADLICDGHLQGNPIWRIDFTSKSIKELKNFEKRIRKLFNVSGKIRQCKSNKYGITYNMGINCSPVARILFLCETPKGRKVTTKFKVPLWISKDKEYFRHFCKRVFSCEGTIMNDGRKIPQIRMEMWKEYSILKNGINFLKKISSLMESYFDIKSSVSLPKSKCNRKDGLITKPIRLYIFGNSVIKFYKEIGFEGDKQKSLKEALAK